MSAERIKKLLFEVGAALDRAKSSKEFEALAGQYRALKNQWNKQTNNALLCEILSEVQL